LPGNATTSPGNTLTLARASSPPPPARPSGLWPGVALALVVAALYVQVAGAGFVYIDDKEYIYKNPVVQQGLTWAGAAWAFTSIGYANNWHPLTWLSHMLDVQLFGLNPGAHHLVNAAFHATNTVLLFLMLRSLTGALWRSAFVALLFGVHPLHVESVAWISERKDLLSSLFWVLATWRYAAFTRRPGKAPYLSALGLFALGLLTKPMIVTLPLVLLLFDYWPLGRFRGALARREVDSGSCGQSAASIVLEKVPFFALALATALVTLRAQQHLLTTTESLPAWPRIANAIEAYAAYLGKTFWPAGLTIFYPHPGRDVHAGAVALSLALLVATTWWALRAGSPYVKTGWLWYLVTLVPVIGLVQVGPQAMADRYTYLPLIGVFVLVTWGAADWARRRGASRSMAVMGVAAVLVLLPVTWRQIGVWRNNLALYRHAVDVIPGSWLGQSNLGAALEDSGDVGGAVTHYREAIRIRPTFSPAYNNLALVLFSQGRVDEAVTLFAEAVRLTPGNARMLTNYAVALAAGGRTAEARRFLQRALEIAPDDREARQELSRLTNVRQTR